jgi:hypothetical protein
MKQNITLAIDKRLLKRIRAFAAEREISVSGMLAQELLKMVEQEAAYECAKGKALAHLDALFHLGGKGITSRQNLHERCVNSARPNC